jgi:hypothetical protein
MDFPAKKTSLVRLSKNPVHRVIASGSVSKLAQLAQGLDPDDVLGPVGARPTDCLNVVDEGTGYTPLQLAIVCGHHDCISYLIQHGADVNRVRDDPTRDTALTLAAKKGTIALRLLRRPTCSCSCIQVILRLHFNC